MASGWAILSVFLAMLFRFRAIEFNMQFMTKCIAEDVSASSPVEIEYFTYDRTDVQKEVGTKVIVEDPKGNNVFEGSGDAGNITFKSKIEGEYKACFTVPSNRLAVRVRIRLDWRTGATSFDWDSVAKKEHLDQIDTYMERFKSTIKAVTEELKEIRSKEQEMREIAEGTNTRVVVLSVSCVIICLALTAGQYWYLRRFFLKKKII